MVLLNGSPGKMSPLSVDDSAGSSEDSGLFEEESSDSSSTLESPPCGSDKDTTHAQVSLGRNAASRSTPPDIPKQHRKRTNDIRENGVAPVSKSVTHPGSKLAQKLTRLGIACNRTFDVTTPRVPPGADMTFARPVIGPRGDPGDRDNPENPPKYGTRCVSFNVIKSRTSLGFPTKAKRAPRNIATRQPVS